MHPPASEISTLLLALLKEVSGMMLMLSVMLFLAARDPVRNVAIIDGLIVGLCILSITPLLSLKMLDFGSLYPLYLIWGRALVRLILAGVLFCARPRGTEVAQGEEPLWRHFEFVTCRRLLETWSVWSRS
jgi:hypothetical protein